MRKIVSGGLCCFLLGIVCCVVAYAEPFPDKELYQDADKEWESVKREQAYHKFKKLVDEHPTSVFSGKANLKIGLYLKSKKRFLEAVEANRRVITQFPGSYDASEATSRIACIYNLMGDGQNALKHFRQALTEAKDWRQLKYAAAWTRWIYFNRHRFEARLCGPRSLARVLGHFGKPVTPEELSLRLAEKKEITLHDLAMLSGDYGLKTRGVKVAVNKLKKAYLPMLIYVPPDHFSVLDGVTRNKAFVFDPLRGEVTYDRATLEKIWPGEGLIFSAKNASFPRLAFLSEEKMKNIKGSACGCCFVEKGCKDGTMLDSPPGAGGNPGKIGMPAVKVDTSTLNVMLMDTPIRYDPGTGEPMDFSITYNNDDYSTSQLGNGWSFSYGSYILNDDIQVNVIRGSGREDAFFYDENSGSYLPPAGVHDALTRDDNVFTLETFPGHRKYYYDTGGNVTGKLTAIENAWNHQVKLFYDDNRNLIKVVDANGTGPDDPGFGLYVDENTGMITEIRDPLNRNARFFYDENGSMTKIIDMAGQASEMGYDVNKYLISLSTPKGGGATTQFRFSTTGFDEDEQGYYQITKIIDPLGNPRTYEHYEFRGSNQIQALNNNCSEYLYGLHAETAGAYRYDGQTSYQLDYWYDPVTGNLTKFGNENGVVTTYEYGERGLVTKMTDPLSQVTEYYYDPSSLDLTRTKFGNNVTCHYYGSHHEITRTVYPDDTEENFFFDAALGRPTKITDRRGNSTEYYYDASGYLTKMVEPEGNSTVFAYDGVGRKVSMVDGENGTTGYSYDALDRITRITYPGGDHADYFFDCCALTKAIDVNYKQTVYVFDKNTRLLTVTDAEGNSTSYSYDGVGNLISMQDAGGYVTSYFFDWLNRITKIGYADSSQETYAYDKVGNLTKKIDANGNDGRFFYDALNRLTCKKYFRQ